MKRIPKASAFTLVELLVLICLVVVLILTMPTTPRARKSLRMACVKNLQNIGLAHRIFATDNGDKFPSELSGAQTNDIAAFLGALTNEIASPKIFHCPADKGRSPAASWASFSTNNISYFVNVNAAETYPQSFLAGDSDLSINGRPLASGRNIVPVTATVSWSTNRHMGSSAIVMGDGSVQQLSWPRLRDALANSGTNDMILLAP